MNHGMSHEEIVLLMSMAFIGLALALALIAVFSRINEPAEKPKIPPAPDLSTSERIDIRALLRKYED